MQQLAGALPEVKLAIDKRAKKLLDYDAQRAKVRKLVEKPDNDASKLPRVGYICFPLLPWESIHGVSFP
jgi:hypothetical protein